MVWIKKEGDVSGEFQVFLHAISRRTSEYPPAYCEFFISALWIDCKEHASMLIGMFVFDEMGHAYNYFFVHNRDPRFGLRMVPYQFLYGSVIMLVLLKLFGWF